MANIYYKLPNRAKKQQYTMKVIQTSIPDVLILEPNVFGDARGFFLESFNRKAFKEKTGIDRDFVQDNHSRSQHGVLRGLHYQLQQAQGKLVRVVKGRVFDVAVDMRQQSSTFGQWVGIELSEENQRMFWVPEGFAHGFLVLSESADFLYKTTDYYAPQHECSLLWNDETLKIDWPLHELSCPPKLSAKDAEALPFAKAKVF